MPPPAMQPPGLGHSDSGTECLSPESRLDRKAHDPPSYSPRLYAQNQDLKKVLPFRENNAQLPPIQTSRRPPSPHEAGEPRHEQFPSMSSVAGSSTGSPTATPEQPPAMAPTLPPNHWPSLNPLTAYYTPGHVQSGDSPLRMDVDSGSSSPGHAGATSPDRFRNGRAGSVSLDDPDVRLAAEALGDLRADFVSSPPARSSPLPPTSSPGGSNSSEPLLSLLTTSHPLLAKTIEGTTSAYNTSKNYSPRFKSGAEYVEGYLAPIGNTIGSVSRVTGVEGSVRWFLSGARRRGHQHPSSAEDESSKPSFYKRRKLDLRRGRASSGTGSGSGNEPQPEASAATKSRRAETSAEGGGYDFNEERRLSMSTVETLPAYDDARSPAYTESVDGSMQVDSTSNDGRSATRPQMAGGPPQAWQTRLIMSTSGLSIAMSEESLRSLKYCLNWLRWANSHVDKVIASLKTALDQYDSAHDDSTAGAGREQRADEVAADRDAAIQANRRELEARIASLRSDLLTTLRTAVETVSKYAGGALPENARVLVRKHLTSLPQRFRLAQQADPPNGEAATDKDVREGAQLVLVLAKEGLDMISQVSGVLDGTIVSAEEWCEKLGKKKNRDNHPATAEPQRTQHPTAAGANGDVIMH